MANLDEYSIENTAKWLLKFHGSKERVAKFLEELGDNPILLLYPEATKERKQVLAYLKLSEKGE